MRRPAVVTALLLTVSVCAGCADDGAPPRRLKQDTEGAQTGTTGPLPCNANPQTLAGCVEAAGYDGDLGFIADIRTPGSTHWQAVQDLCFDRLTELGYEIEVHEYQTGINIVGRRFGATNPEQEVLIGAHYDHLPGCTGADDNATGVAGALETARVLALAEFDKTITIGCWDQEEIGKVGSREYARMAVMRGDQYLVNFNYEMIGYVSEEPGSQQIPFGFDQLFPEAVAKVEASEYRGNFIAIAADDLATPFAQPMLTHAETIGLPTAYLELEQSWKTNLLFDDLRRSDHASFWDQDVPAMMITDSANFRNLNYHCTEGEDSVDRLSTEFATSVIAITVAAAAEAAGLRG